MRTYYQDLDTLRRAEVLSKALRLAEDLWATREDQLVATRRGKATFLLRHRLYLALGRLQWYISGASDLRVPYDRAEFNSRLVGCNGHDDCRDCRDVHREAAL